MVGVNTRAVAGKCACAPRARWRKIFYLLKPWYHRWRFSSFSAKYTPIIDCSSPQEARMGSLGLFYQFPMKTSICRRLTNIIFAKEILSYFGRQYLISRIFIQNIQVLQNCQYRNHALIFRILFVNNCFGE